LQRNKWLDQPFQSNYVGVNNGGEPYVPFEAKGHNPGFPGFRSRTSQRWLRTLPTSREMVLPVPYIDRFGKFTIHLLGVWKTRPETWFVSVASTIDSRLWYLYRHYNKKSKLDTSSRNLITRVSLYYAWSHNNYFIDRIIANLLKGRFKVIKSILTSFTKRAGETFRFVYSQTCLQVSWLNFRSKWIRDKPKGDDPNQKFSHIVSSNLRKGTFKYIIANPFCCALDFTRINRLEWTRNNVWCKEEA